MKYLKIQNNGELDIRLVALMGGTTKSKDEFKIGQFGTGLKYTLAFLIRNNIDFKIFVGTEEVKIYVEQETIKGEVFEIICINGNRTSITTKMGEDWKAWMIVREIWCNALDEGGAVKEETETLNGLEGNTSFFIQVESQIRDVIKNWERYFIHGVTPVSSTERFDIYHGGSHLKIYKHGVLIHEDEHQKALFSYDIKNADINELREYRGSLSMDIYSSLANADRDAIKYFLENITDAHYEGDMDYDWFYNDFTDKWKEVIGTAKIIHQEALNIIKEKELDFDTSGLIIVPKGVYKALTKKFEGIGALRVANKVNEFYEIYNEALDSRIKQGLAILEQCGYFIHPELKFIYGVFGDKNKLACVYLDKKEILISERMSNSSLFEIVAMLIEENEHFNTGFCDKTREFQQHFINLFTKKLLEKEAIEI